MSGPVDVLAVLDDMASTVQLVSAEHKAWHARIVAARAAVAELINKADIVATAMSNLIAAQQVDAGYGQYVTELTAALANVGSAS